MTVEAGPSSYEDVVVAGGERAEEARRAKQLTAVAHLREDAEVEARERELEEELLGSKEAEKALSRARLANKFAERVDAFRRHEEKLGRRAEEAERRMRRERLVAEKLRDEKETLAREVEACREFIAVLHRAQRGRLTSAISDAAAAPFAVITPLGEASTAVPTLESLAHAELCELRQHAHALAEALEKQQRARRDGDDDGTTGDPSTPTARRGDPSVVTYEATERLERALEREHARTAAAKVELRCAVILAHRRAARVVAALARRIPRCRAVRDALRTWRDETAETLELKRALRRAVRGARLARKFLESEQSRASTKVESAARSRSWEVERVALRREIDALKSARLKDARRVESLEAEKAVVRGDLAAAALRLARDREAHLAEAARLRAALTATDEDHRLAALQRDARLVAERDCDALRDELGARKVAFRALQARLDAAAHTGGLPGTTESATPSLATPLAAASNTRGGGECSPPRRSSSSTTPTASPPSTASPLISKNEAPHDPAANMMMMKKSTNNGAPDDFDDVLALRATVAASNCAFAALREDARRHLLDLMRGGGDHHHHHHHHHHHSNNNNNNNNNNVDFSGDVAAKRHLDGASFSWEKDEPPPPPRLMHPLFIIEAAHAKTLDDDAADVARALAAERRVAREVESDLAASRLEYAALEAAVRDRERLAEERAAGSEAELDAERAGALASIERARRANVRCVRLAVRASKAESVAAERLEALRATQAQAARQTGAALAALDDKVSQEAARAALDGDLERRLEVAKRDLAQHRRDHDEALRRARADAARHLDAVHADHARRLANAVRSASEDATARCERDFAAREDQRLADANLASPARRRRHLPDDEGGDDDDDDDDDEAPFDASEARAAIGVLERRVAFLEAALGRCDASRRKLHNSLQELRGNVRVVARIRGGAPRMLSLASSDLPAAKPPKSSRRPPVAAAALRDDATVAVRVPDRASVDGASRTVRQAASQKKHVAFAFDRAFGPEATQAAVFAEVADLCQSAADGYDVCILAYGATGSGKTHTMHGGGTGGGADEGVVPRACAALAQTKARLEAEGWTFAVDACYVEVYDERLYDLLADNDNNNCDVVESDGGDNKGGDEGGAPRSRTKGGRHPREVAVGAAWADEDPQAALSGATWVALDVRDRAAMRRLEARAHGARRTAATRLNDRSSRSHAVFTLRLQGDHTARRERVHGSLSLVDLAGAERVALSGALDDATQLREACAINRSLSCLVDVFTALARKATHVPYRNSKLTMLLKRALSNHGKALVIATVEADETQLHQTTSTLRFAHSLAAIDKGKVSARRAKTTPAIHPKKSAASSSSSLLKAAARAGGERTNTAKKKSLAEADAREF